MGDRNSQLAGRDRACHCRRDIAHDEAQVAYAVQQHPFVAHRDASGLLGLRPRPHFEVEVGLGNSELVEESARHGAIVALAPVNETVVQHASPHLSSVQAVDDGRGLHEIRPRPGDEVNQFRPDTLVTSQNSSPQPHAVTHGRFARSADVDRRSSSPHVCHSQP